ncbi:hypothetical protein [Blastopirellula retiformator]|uniref:Uncharacterized protein n=1 Tax=Blastopirellula retiformator TaxID=2527970 RepID=A0A5C5V8Q7_9BACT|nr:hypothetical protein [Blastopirellula retiformator]TWT34115.1 hypothetical protein Enr8_15070 [Blastopirellula retiformator]
MQDIEPYQHILGLKSPWSVDRVQLSVEEEQIDVFVSAGWRC